MELLPSSLDLNLLLYMNPIFTTTRCVKGSYFFRFLLKLNIDLTGHEDFLI